jgi:hypothetical protein
LTAFLDCSNFGIRLIVNDNSLGLCQITFGEFSRSVNENETIAISLVQHDITFFVFVCD